MEIDRYANLRATANRLRLKDLFAILDPNTSCLLVKGYSISRFYPDDLLRISTDIDIAVESTHYDSFSLFLSGLDVGIPIDLHKELRSLDLLPWDELLSHSYEFDLDGVPVRVLADEDNLRVTAVHWLTDGGVNKERLRDIYYLVKNRKEDFDWDRCLESNGPIRKTWVMAAIATARDHLDLDVSGLPEDAQQFQLPDWYEKTLEKEWKRGVYPRRMLSTVMFRPKLLLEQLHRRFPPNKIAASIDTESPIDDSSRLPAQMRSLAKKVLPFARGLGRRLTYSRQYRERN